MIRCLLTLTVCSILHSGDAAAEYAPAEGDLILQSTPHTPLTDTIESCTASLYSHCGIVTKSNRNQWQVIEAHGPVGEIALSQWINRGREKHHAVFRLLERYRKEMPKFIAAARTYTGKPYDIHMSLDDGALYCSELLYKSFKTTYHEELGKLVKLGDLNWKPNEGFIRFIEQGGLPLERQMITPKAITESDKVTLVFTSYPKPEPPKPSKPDKKP
ncbi:MAG: YiiX/YebB-like N1pC/P60 family cysteine hydrolase [Planctomycetota bacterium]